MANKAIEKAIHSNGPLGFGLTAGGELVNRGRFVSDTASRVRLFDDFLGDVIADQWAVVEGADTTTSDAAIVSGIGGTLVLTTGDSATVTYDGNGIQVTQGAFYNWRASTGGLRLEARLKISDISTAAFFVGFTDVGTFEAPIESAGSGNTLTTNATDAVGFMFDTRMTADTIWLVGVKGDTDATAQNSLIAPVNDTYITLAVEVDLNEIATFFINGVRVGTTMTGAITKTAALTPTIAAASLTTATRTITVDYIDVEMDRV